MQKDRRFALRARACAREAPRLLRASRTSKQQSQSVVALQAMLMPKIALKEAKNDFLCDITVLYYSIITMSILGLQKQVKI